MKKLLVISNHPPEKWGMEQKAGWDKIEFIPFPEVPPQAGEQEVSSIAEELCNRIVSSPCEYVCLQGEFSVVAVIFRHIGTLQKEAEGEFIPENSASAKLMSKKFVFPTTERVVEEVKKEDGRVEKLYHFKFVRWREI